MTQLALHLDLVNSTDIQGPDATSSSLVVIGHSSLLLPCSLGLSEKWYHSPACGGAGVGPCYRSTFCNFGSSVTTNKLENKIEMLPPFRRSF
ncbi:hypothetical protein MTR_4g087410, partial [Medicago truncatula]